MRRKKNNSNLQNFLLLALIICVVIGCAVITTQQRTAPITTAPVNAVPTVTEEKKPQAPPIVTATKVAKLQKTITIASFNIQILGDKKIANPEIMQTVARIIRRFDIVAIQEVRSIHDDIIPTLLNYVNTTNPRYGYVISSRLGRSNSKEQYAFIFNTSTIQARSNSTYVVDDPDDVFEREPFVASFKSGNFDFTIVDIHTKPEDTPAELQQLSVVLNNIYTSSKEKDIIAMGDMNADGSYCNESSLASTFSTWVQLIGNSVDTTVASKSNTYDRMISSPDTAGREYANQSGVFRWDTEFGVTDMAFVKTVSDHYPVYAVFRTDLPDDD